MEKQLKILFAFIILWLPSPFTWSSPQGIRMRGSVVDENGKPVADLEVRIQTPEKSAFITRTDAAGLFDFAADSRGEYSVGLNKAGFFRIFDQRILLNEGDNEITFTVNHETEIHQEVEVYSTDEGIKPLVTSHSEELVAREIRDIPVQSTHDLRNSLQVLPEVVRDHSGQLHIAGGRTGEAQYLLDGFDIGDSVTGDLSIRVNVDSLRFAEVESGRYGAQYGNAGAGVLAMDTATGDDKWRAGATNFIPGVSAQRGIHLTSWYPRLTLSGPIMKERAWFSEALSVQRTLSLIEDLPSKEDSVSQWAGDNMLRTQFRINPKNQLQGNFLYNQLKASNIGLSPFSPISTTKVLRSYRSFASLKEQLWSGRTFYEIGIAADFAHSESSPHGYQPYRVTPNGSSGNYFEGLRHKTRRWQMVGSMSMPTRRRRGTHDLQFGFSAAELKWTQIAWRNAIEVVRTDDSPLQRTEFSGAPKFEIGDTLAGIYGHDVWRMTRALVLQFGLRVDWDRMIQRTTPSPRISVNILPFKRDNAKFTASWGIFLQPVTLSNLGPAYDQQRSDIFFGISSMPPTTGPVISHFVLPMKLLKQPRFQTISLGWEQGIGEKSQFELNFTQRNGRLGLAYENLSTDENSRLFVLQNNRRDRYRSLQLSLKHSFSSKTAVSGSYTRSSTRSNQVFDYSLNTIVFAPQQSGPLSWDAPNRIVSSGWAPAPIWNLFLSYFLEYRTGYPFSIMNERQQLVGGANQKRFPNYLSLNVGVEKRIHLFTRDWAVRVTVLNVTGHRSPDSVINNIDSPNFMKYAGGQRRAFSARIRLVR